MPTHNPNPGGGRRPKEVTGRMVLICLVAFFGVIGGVNAVMVYAAVSTFGGAETASAYKAGLSFSRETAAARAQETLRWQVAASFRPSEHGLTLLEVTASDVAGRPLTSLQATAQLAHPTDKRADHFVELVEAAPGRFVGTAALATGQRDLVIELWHDGARLFHSRNRVTLQ